MCAFNWKSCEAASSCSTCVIPAFHVPLYCCSYSKILSFFPVSFFPSASPYPCDEDRMRLLLLSWCSVTGLSQRAASGWAVRSTQQMLKQDFLSTSGCCWGHVAQQGYLRTQILLYIAELSIPCAEVHLGCCINRLFHVKHPSLPLCKMKFFSLWPLGIYVPIMGCWDFLPVDINKSVWWCISEISVLSL